MNAKEARKLKVGDWVLAHFAQWMRGAEIIDIQWPRFLLRRIGSDKQLMERWRTYRSLCGRTEPGSNKPTDREPPNWLVWPESHNKPK